MRRISLWKVARPDAIQVLHDEKVVKSLARYFDVFQNRKQAKFMIAKKTPARFTGKESHTQLWQLHEKLTKQYYEIEKKIDAGKTKFEDLLVPELSYLDLKIEIANRLLEDCSLCVRRCKINRLAGKLGYCKSGVKITVSTMFEHMGEEPELVPSGTVFTCGCNLTCKHCQNWTISQWYETGEIMGPEMLAKAVEKLRNTGCRNVNMVGGEPTPWLAQWLETMKHVKVNIPVVWNSNSYYSEETAKLLAGFADVYLLDFKYGTNTCSTKISNAPCYWETCTKNHLYAKKYGELIIRVLVLPEHLECCTKKILEWIAENLGNNTRTNIMFQYRPEWRASEIPELRRRLTLRETEHVIELADLTGLTNYTT